MRDVQSQHTVTLRVFLPVGVNIRRVDVPWCIKGHNVVQEWEIVATDDVTFQRADEKIAEVQAAIAYSLENG